MRCPEDHFSAIAPQYSRGRFGYPSGLFDFLSTLCREHDLAWDCATGNGQSATALAERFKRVVATDISSEMLARGMPHSKVAYRCEPAESSTLETGSVDLVTVAQALHWIEHERFWSELERVSKRAAIFSYWSYLWPSVGEEIDAWLSQFRTLIGPHWPQKSRLVHREYRELAIPFSSIPSPGFEISASWRREDCVAHLESWSAVRYAREAGLCGPIEELFSKLEEAWPSDDTRRVRWPLLMGVYRIK